MALSTLLFIIFFLLFIIFSPIVDEKSVAAQMEHRKLGGAKETITTRRNLEGNGNGSKIATPRSMSRHSGQKNIDREPSKTKPDQATTQGKQHYLGYRTLQRSAVCDGTFANCLGPVPTGPTPCTVYNKCKRAADAGHN